jgi:DNA-binding CsgD family transcriptional regulator
MNQQADTYSHAETNGTSTGTNGIQPADPFIARLRATVERVRHTGVSTDDVLALTSLAHVFPGLFAAAYDHTGRYLWVSPTFATLTGISPAAVVGKRLVDLFAPAWTKERMAVIARTLALSRPIPTVEVYAGRRVEGVSLPAVSGSPHPIVTYVGRFGISLASASAEVMSAHAAAIMHDGGVSGMTHDVDVPVMYLEEAHWGPLAVLSRRELEVLRLIAMGLDNAQIARKIFRTKRAVEWHISSLYRLLNRTQRTDLFRIGFVAGLPDIDEVHWERMMLKVHDGRSHDHTADLTNDHTAEQHDLDEHAAVESDDRGHNGSNGSHSGELADDSSAAVAASNAEVDTAPTDTPGKPRAMNLLRAEKTATSPSRH